MHARANDGDTMTPEARTCREYVVPKLIAAGWDASPHIFTEQDTFTDGRIVIDGEKATRKKGKRSDYLLRYTRDFAIAVVEAKADYKLPGDGMQQAKEYAEILGLKFAYATNGKGIVEFDFITGREREISMFPLPEELWSRLREAEGLTDEATTQRLLTPFNLLAGFTPRYYQEIAVNRAVGAVLQGKRRILITMATGTGKTFVALQICWKLWQSRWNRTGAYRRPKILYLSDRNLLIDDPKDKTFAVFGDARWKIEGGVTNKSREIYFAIYQAIAKDKRRPGLYKEYAPDFFDLIIVDECHRGSARDDSNWREILEYFVPAYQLGMTATPLREDNRDTYAYFGDPIYTYSLKQGIEDGFLAPYRVHRIITTWDATGWRPSQGELDRFGREIPEGEYHTRDFERIVALRARTDAIARHLTDFLKGTDRFAKTIVFCVDQEHADAMRRAINNLNTDITREYPDYVCRVTSEEGDVGRTSLSRFQELETKTPTILTTSKLLTTGVDVPTCKNVVIARVVNAMTEFKQIIGRGTRVRDDYGKFFFNIIDYTGSATRLFADPEFDGEPESATEERIDETGRSDGSDHPIKQIDGSKLAETGENSKRTAEPRKYYYDGGYVEIAFHMVYDFDSDGNQFRIVKFTDYAGEKVRTLIPSDTDLRQKWANPFQRAEIVSMLAEYGISFTVLASAVNQPEADFFDLLCHIAFNAPLLTRRERANRLQRKETDFFNQYGAKARAILDALLEKYAEHGADGFAIPDVLKVPPLSGYGNVIEIASFFGGASKLRDAVNQIQRLLYAA